MSLLGAAICTTLLLCTMIFLVSAATHHNRVVPCPPYLSSTKFQFSRGIPEGCAQSECDYFVGINPSVNENLLEFTLEGNARGWLAVGFSKTPSMYSADVVGCSRHSSGVVTVTDTWNFKHFKYNFMKEQQDDMCHYGAWYDHGRMKCMFSRTIKGSNFEYDLDLNDNYYLLFGIGQTPKHYFTQGLTYHSGTTPIISEMLINPVSGRSTVVNATWTAAFQDRSDTTSTAAHTTMATTVTLAAAEVDEIIQKESTTYSEPQKTSICPSSPLNPTPGPYQLTHNIPSGCDPSQCDFFVGISTNADDENLLDFTLKGSAKGWVAIGFSKTPDMNEADVFGCNVYSNGSVMAIDTWNPLSPKTNVLDIDQSDICSYDAEFKDGGRLSCRFSRSIRGSSSEQDLDLNNDYYLIFGRGQKPQMLGNGGFTYHNRESQMQKARILITTLLSVKVKSPKSVSKDYYWKQASSGGFTYHEQTPYISLELINPVNSSNDDLKIEVIREVIRKTDIRALTKTHGILMIIAWPILAGTAIYYSAFMKPVLNKKGGWFYVHKGLMLTSIVFTSVSLAVIFIAHLGSPVSGLVDLHDTFPLTHFVIGITVVASQIFNMFLSLFRCKPSSRFRWIYNILHGKLIGYITILLSLANIAVGIYLFDSEHSPAFKLSLIAAILGVLMHKALHLLYNVVPRLLKLHHEEGEEEQSLLSINEKYTNNTDSNESSQGELKSALAHSYRHHYDTLVLVLTVIVPLNIAVCVIIAIA